MRIPVFQLKQVIVVEAEHHRKGKVRGTWRRKATCPGRIEGLPKSAETMAYPFGGRLFVFMEYKEIWRGR